MTWRNYSKFSATHENKDPVGAGPGRNVLRHRYLLNMTQSAISHQLRVLKQAHLVKSRREGKVVYYSLADEHVKLILDQGLIHITEEDIS